MNRHLLWLALGAALFAPCAAAQSPAAAPSPAARPAPAAAPAPRAAPAAARRAELEVARRELERASSRFAEIAQTLAGDEIETALARRGFDRPVIGVVLSGDEGAGVRLAAVTPKSPAADAGLRSGDRLLRIRGSDIGGKDSDARLATARAAIGHLEKGERVELTIERDGKRRDVTVAAASLPGVVWWRGETPQGLEVMRYLQQPSLPENFPMELGQLAPLAGCGANGDGCVLQPMAEAYRWRGLRLAALEAKLGRYFGSDRGVLVLTTPNETLPALEPGDVLLRIDGEPVDLPQEVMREMRAKAPGEQIAIEFLRDRKRRTVSVDAPKLARFPLLAPPPPPAPPVAPAPPAPVAPPAGVPSLPLPAAPAPPSPPSPPLPPSEDDDASLTTLSANEPGSTSESSRTARRGVLETVLQR
jgi:hypothetical protein